MNFNLKEAMEVLERTPPMLEHFLSGLSESWLHCNEGDDTWNVEEVVEHLIEAERTNWIPRLEVALRAKGDKTFPPFDRFRHLKEKPAGTIAEKLQTFKQLRTDSLSRLRQLIDSEAKLDMTGIHPQFGEVKARELISTWVVHDLTHTAQIVRIMAKRYREDVGPWIEFLGILKK